MKSGFGYNLDILEVHKKVQKSYQNHLTNHWEQVTLLT